jgi:hypothetical protein
MKRIAFAALMCMAVSSGLLQDGPISLTAQSTETSQSPEQLKARLLERMVRLPPTYRGDNNARLKWEWYEGIARSYRYEKGAIVEEVSANQGSLLRTDYVFRGVKVTFQEIFQLTDKDDDKLIPILAHYSLLRTARQNVFEGLTLLGKQGEVKGPITRKYIASARDAGYVGGAYFDFYYVLEYKDQKSGKLERAGGVASDAVNFRWRDIKNLVVDDMTEERAAEDRTLLREAYAKSLKASIPAQ